MIKAKDGRLIFDNVKDLNIEINRRIKPLIDKEIEKHSNAKVQEIMTMLLPVLSTSLYEAYKFSEEKQELCILRVIKNMTECTEENIFEWDEYKEFCEKKGKKFFMMEVEK